MPRKHRGSADVRLYAFNFVKTTPWPLYPREIAPAPAVQVTGQASGPVSTSAENLGPPPGCERRTIKRVALYRLRYPGPSASKIFVNDIDEMLQPDTRASLLHSWHQPLTRQCLGHCPWKSELPQRVEHMDAKITFRTLEALYNGHQWYELTRYEAQAMTFTTHVVIGDKKCVHLYSPERKTKSLVWRHFTSLANKF